MQARDLMTRHEVFCALETDDARSVAQKLAEHNIASLPVLDFQGRLRGMVTDRDLCVRVMAKGSSYDTSVSDVMSEPAHSVGPDASLEEIERTMQQFQIRHLPVVDSDEQLLGFISISDLARWCETPQEEHDLVGVLEAISPSQVV
jgi:CBS domain-containing protein